MPENFYSKTGIARCAQPGCGCRNSSFVWVSHERRMIWYEVPKTASSSIKAALGIQGPRASYNGGFVNLEATPEEAALDYPAYFKFAFVRNPWSRMVSAWSMFCAQQDAFRNQQITTLFERPHDQISFEVFVALAARIRNHHWEQNVRFLPWTQTGASLLDVLGRIEQLEDGVAAIHRQSGLTLTLPRLNATDHAHYAHYYDEDTQQQVARMFAEDIQSLGFTFDQP